MASEITWLGLVALGVVAGLSIDRISLWLPKKLDDEWRIEASEVLGQSHCAQLEFPVARRSGARAFFNVVLCVVLTVGVGHHVGGLWPTAGMLLLAWGLLLLSLIDIDHQLLPDIVVLPLLWGGLIINTSGLLASLEAGVWGAAGGYVFLYLVRLVSRIVTGVEGIGLGDVKMFALLGAWGGWQILPATLVLALGLSLVVTLPMTLMGCRDRRDALSFGPYLAVSGLGVLLYVPFWQQLLGMVNF